MSEILKWVPVKEDGKVLSDRFKCAWRSVYAGDLIADENHLEFLRGISAAGIVDSEKLIAAIKRHGKIKIYGTY